MTGVDDMATLRNYNSSEDLNFTGVKSLVDVELSNVGSAGVGANDPTPDTQLIFAAATVAGTSDALDVTFDSNLNVDGTAIGDFQANGIETFNVTTQNGATSMGQIASNSLLSVTVAGDQDLTLGTVLAFANDGTVDASTFTGDLDVTVNSGVVDVTVTGGTGDDRADFSAGFDTGDSFDGGDGTDTLAVTNAVATGTPAGSVANIEQLEISTAGTGTVDMDDFSGVTKVIYDAGITAAATATVDDAVTGITVEVDATAAGTDNLVVDLKTDGTADEITLEFDEIAAGDAIASVNAADAETLNMSFDDDTANGTGTFTMTSLTATDATSMILTGDADFTLTSTVGPATPVLATIDASGMTGDVTISGTNTAAAGATITFGSGDDTFNVATSNGADTITLGTGADKVVYTLTAQSDDDMDTITDFVSGTDSLDFSALDGNPLVTFAGNRASFGLAQGALPGTGVGSGLTAVYQVDDQILWIDSNGDGTLDNRDFRVQLTDVTSLVDADVGLTAGNTVTLSAASANVDLTTSTNADKSTTNQNDTIISSVANLAASTIDGAIGTDTLQISDAGTFAIDNQVGANAVTNVEALQLANGTNVVTFADTAAIGGTEYSSITNVTGGTGADTVTSTGILDGGTISLGGGVDVFNLAEAMNTGGATTDIDLGTGNDNLVSTVGC